MKKKKLPDLAAPDSLGDTSRVLVSQLSSPPRPNSRNLPANGITAENDISDHDDELEVELDESQNLDDDDHDDDDDDEDDDDDGDEVLTVGASRLRLAGKFASPQVHITST